MSASIGLFVVSLLFFSILVVHWIVSIAFVLRDSSLSTKAKVGWVSAKAVMIGYSIGMAIYVLSKIMG